MIIVAQEHRLDKRTSSSSCRRWMKHCCVYYLVFLTVPLQTIEAFQPISSQTSCPFTSWTFSSSSFVTPFPSVVLYAKKSTKIIPSSSQQLRSLNSVPSGERLNNLKHAANKIRQILSSSNGYDKDDSKHEIRSLLQYMIENAVDQNNHPEKKLLIETLRLVSSRAFLSTYNSSWDRVQFGLEMMEILSNFDSLTRSLCIQGLKALNDLMRNNASKLSPAGYESQQHEECRKQANAAYRILQRMCTGVGMCQNGDVRVQIALDERDFAMVLNGFVNIGEMNMAHRVVALQQRTKHAPPLSPVIYSIMIKGYGRLCDVVNVERVFEQAKKDNVVPDIIMLNSLMDAYINCDCVSKAFDIFESLTTQSRSSLVEQERTLPSANLRTYNTMLKGFVKSKNISRALAVSKEMQKLGIWDAITTNTLVGVAVAAKNFEMAESILDKYTSDAKSYRDERGTWHPNVEAYTELLDGYAKDGKLGKALEILRIMRNRGVPPNEYTYTCIIGALAKAQKVNQALKMLSFMSEGDRIQPSIVTYNALLTGMLLECGPLPKKVGVNREPNASYHGTVNDAIQVYEGMLQAGIRPNEITISTLVEAFGYCQPSRMEEAISLVDHVHTQGVVSKQNARVATSLICAYGHSSDLEGALSTYRTIQNPDVVALNALLKAYCSERKLKSAIEILNTNLNIKQDGTSAFVTPDVVTYTIIISSLLAVGTPDASKAAYKFYKEMKNVWDIRPDTGLVDAILTPMVSGGNNLGQNDLDASFVKEVLRDATLLNWPAGHLQRRERTVQSVFTRRRNEAWKKESHDSTIIDDPLFKKKNWNRIDSGFRLWGSESTSKKRITKSAAETNVEDPLFQKKKWNKIDSGFRLWGSGSDE